MHIFKIALLLIIINIGNATTLFDNTSNCPVCDDSVTTRSIGSYGSYIYFSDSKYDLIYWPDNDIGWYWLCNSCGYAQHGNDFFNIEESKKIGLKDWLADYWEPIPEDTSTYYLYNSDSVLNQVAKINIFLDRDDDFWIWFNRVLINHFRGNDSLKAIEIAKEEVKLLENNTHIFSNTKKRNLYLLGEYNRIIGNDILSEGYLKKSLFTTYARIEKYGYYFSLLILGVSLIVIWILLKKKYIIKIILSLLIITGFTFLAIHTYKQNFDELNDYYNDIIIDRIYLLKHK